MPANSQIDRDIQALSKIISEMVVNSSRTVNAQQANIEMLQDMRDELKKFYDSLVQGRKLNAKQEQLVNQAMKQKREEIEELRRMRSVQRNAAEILKRQNVSDKTKAAQSTVIARAQKAYQDAIGETNVAAKRVHQSFEGLVGGINVANTAIAWFGSALATQAKTLVAQHKANGGVVESSTNMTKAFGYVGDLFNQQLQAFSQGISPAELAALQTQYRQTLNAGGGFAKTIAVADDELRKSYQIMSGDLTNLAVGMKLALNSVKQLRESGINPTTVNLERYRADIERLQKTHGLSAEAAQDFYGAMMQDVDSIDILRSAREGERAAILESQRSFITAGHGLKMTAEQAKAATMMLNKMAAAKPLDRLKQAARVRAMGAAMGIGGADEAAKAIIAGKRMTDAQRKNLADFNVNMTNAMDKMGTGSLGGEIFATTLADKLDLDQYFGKGSPFSTSLGEALKPSLDINKDLKSAVDDGAARTVTELSKIYNQITGFVSGEFFGGVGAAAASAAAAILLRKPVGSALAAGGKLLNGLKGGSTAATAAANAAMPATAGVAQAAAPAVQAGGKLAAAAKVGGTILKTAGVVGTVVDVGSGVSDLAQGKKQESLDGWDMISPMRWGMRIGDAINKAVESSGDTIGGKIYDWTHKDPMSVPVPPESKQKTKAADKTNEITKKTSDATDVIKDASVKTATTLEQQVKKMDASNDTLTKLVNLTEKQIDLAERQLVAYTMSDKERQDKSNKATLRSDSKFAARYNYLT